MKNAAILKRAIRWLVIFAVGVALAVTLRGNLGNPNIDALNSDLWQRDGPLELSPERGRFALLYSIVEDHSLKFSLPVARLALPDLALTKSGAYVSLFAPAVSFIAAPGYIIGKALGASLVGAYAVIVLFAFLNFFLIRAIALRLGAEEWAALLGALTFSIATPAFAYATTLYQHHVTVFLLLLSLWLLVRFRNIWSLAIIWFACSLAVVVDNPNVFLMFPVGVYSLIRFWEILSQSDPRKELTTGLFGILTFAALLPPLVFFGWYNFHAYGDVFQLPGTLQSVRGMSPDGEPVKHNALANQGSAPDRAAVQRQGENPDKSAIGFFETRNLYNGFYIHFLSPDRSIFWFAPVILLGIFGLVLLYGRHRQLAAVLIACIGATVLLYSMWGDPWGGWAFGSRYFIPSYALLALGVALALSRWHYRLATLVVFIPLFVFSLWVNSLGAVTSIANPPQVEVLALEKQSGHEEKYTFMRNWEFLHGKYGTVGSKAFVYQTWAKAYISAPTYHRIVFGLGLGACLMALLLIPGVMRRLLSLLPRKKV